MKRVTLILILALLSCSSDDNNNTSSQACIESQVVENLLNNTVPGTVFSTQENERAYRSHQKYIQVDAETHLPNIFAQTNEKFARIFTNKEFNLPNNTEVYISGEIFSCLTGDHGLQTNDLFNFYLIENNQMSQE